MTYTVSSGMLNYTIPYHTYEPVHLQRQHQGNQQVFIAPGKPIAYHTLLLQFRDVIEGLRERTEYVPQL